MRVLAPNPTGWFVVSFSHELKQGEIKKITVANREMVLYRTESGKAQVMDAHCIHMGAHLAHGGTIEGEDIRCPFHGFCFNTKGDCTRTGYGTKPSPRLKMRAWPTIERNKLIMVFYDKDKKEPHFDIPELDFSDWTEFRHTSWEFPGHPQETTENSVDVGHFSITHGYTNVGELKPLRTEGPYLTVKYQMTRPSFLPKLMSDVTTHFEIHVHGLGYSLVESEVPAQGLRFRHYILSTPTDEGKVLLRIAMCIKKIEKPGRVNPLLALFPRALTHKLIMNEAFKGYVHDVSQDFDVWNNKIYVDPPYLAKGDGPVMQYRKWAEQFYEETP